jgi:hypothetical protein
MISVPGINPRPTRKAKNTNQKGFSSSNIICFESENVETPRAARSCTGIKNEEIADEHV